MAGGCFKSVLLFDGSGTLPTRRGANLLQSDLKPLRMDRPLDADCAHVVDAVPTLMPGPTEAHSHLSFTNCVT